MIGHSVERATGEEAVGAVDGRAHNSHHIEEVVANTPYTYPYRITASCHQMLISTPSFGNHTNNYHINNLRRHYHL